MSERAEWEDDYDARTVQSLDDRTGSPRAPIEPSGWKALSSAQRSEQMDVLIAQVQALTEHANRLARCIAELQVAAKGHEVRIMGLEARVEALGAPTSFERLVRLFLSH